jgi:hypothetical protein
VAVLESLTRNGAEVDRIVGPRMVAVPERPPGADPEHGAGRTNVSEETPTQV